MGNLLMALGAIELYLMHSVSVIEFYLMHSESSSLRYVELYWSSSKLWCVMWSSSCMAPLYHPNLGE